MKTTYYSHSIPNQKSSQEELEVETVRSQAYMKSSAKRTDLEI